MARPVTKTAVNRSGVSDRTAIVASVDSIRRVLRALRIAARDTLATAGVSARDPASLTLLFMLSPYGTGLPALRQKTNGTPFP